MTREYRAGTLRSPWVLNTRSAGALGTRIVVGLVVVAAVAAIPPAARAEPASYKQSMADGTRLMTARDYAAAAKAFEAALAAKPEDARALAELSWAQFSAGEFETAAQTAVAAQTAAGSDHTLLAMVLYNHGRALEALGRPAEAQEEYTTSLALRDNAEVRSRRAHLGAALLTPRKLAGPFARPEEFCKAPCADDITLDIDVTADADGGEVKHRVRPPFTSVAKILTAEPDPLIYFPIANLALQIGERWYVLPRLGVAGEGHGGGHSIAVHMVGQRLVVDWTSSVGRFGHDDERAVFVCGVGADKHPSCAGPIVTERTSTIDHCGKSENCTRRPDFVVRYHCRATLRGDTLTVSHDPAKIENLDEGVQSGPPPDACKSLPTFGAHALTF